VLAEREFEIGRFYYLRESYSASIARLQSLVEKYPLYSHVDEALYLLAQNFEGQILRLRNFPTCDAHGMPRGCTTEAAKARYIEGLTASAAENYDKILTRYPIMDRADDARRRLAALHQPIPRPTKAAVAQNKAEDASRHESSSLQKLMNVWKKGPDVSLAAKVGEPTLVDPTPISAPEVEKRETIAGLEQARKGSLAVTIVKPDQSAPTDAPPSSEAAATSGSPFGKPATPTAPATPDENELKPNAPADPNELKPIDNGGDKALPPPPQVNEIQQGQSSSATASPDGSAPASDAELSSSKKAKKKGLKKIIPF
jgi:outer membrane protein assembly factor BamD